VDIDFAENHEIVHVWEISSQHWSHDQLTFFVSTSKYLVDADFWKRTGTTAVGQNVICEHSGESFFAEVAGFEGNGESVVSIYHVKTPSGDQVPIQRQYPRWRNERTVAHVFATGDQNHDTHAVQRLWWSSNDGFTM